MKRFSTDDFTRDLAEARPEVPIAEIIREEIVVEKPQPFSSTDTPTPRQAGTIDPHPHSEVLEKFRKLCEKKLYYFAKGVMGMTLLTEELHKPACEWLETCPPRRKLLLFPRDHLKTSIVGRSLAPHILIQPKDDNMYFPGCQEKMCRYRRAGLTDCDDPTHRFNGSDTRNLLGYETMTNAKAQLRWIEGQWEGNELLRALWPEKVWGNAKRQSPAWNAEKMILPRDNDYPEPSIDTIGVDGAVTGRHYNVHIFDDLCTLEAANSAVVMDSTITWFKASRALMDDPVHSLEFIIGTRWAVYDLYQYIMDNDPTVEVNIRSVVEDGKPIFPQVFTPEVIEQKRKQFGTLFPLLYMNTAHDAAITDFNLDYLRTYRNIEDGNLEITLTDADDALAHALLSTTKAPKIHDGSFRTLSQFITELHEGGRDEYLRAQYARYQSS